MSPKLLLALVAAVAAVAAVRADVPLPTGPPRGGAAHGEVRTSKKLIDSPLDDVQWADSRTVFVLSEQGVVYRSTDGGATWTNQSPKMRSHSSSPSIRSVHLSPKDPHTLFLMGHGGESFVSHDMGKTYEATMELDLHEVKMHPHQPLWLLGGAMSSGCHQEPKVNCHKGMYVTKDGGKSWHESLRYVVQFDWAPPLRKHDKKTPKAPAPKHKPREPIDHDNLVFATVHSVKHGNQQFGSWDAAIHMFESYDYFKTEHEIVRHGNRFLFGDHGFLFAAAVNPRQENEVSLRVSRDKEHGHGNTRHRVHHFKTAILPVELTEHSYTILDTSEGSVFLHVNHQPFHLNAPVGHVYISDWSGTQYSLSLPYNHRSGDGKCDFEAVASVEGVYLANFIDEADEEDQVEEWNEDQNDAGFGGAGATSRRTRAKTVITFDKGGIWSYLEPPSHDSAGKKVACATRDCHLHLHGITDLYGPFYSSKTATGLIMATGTVGSFLQENIDRINTYLSRDAGLTWYEVAKGSHIYEFGDHGGLIVMAYDEGETDTVLYSWDQGESWKELKISESPLQVENIIIEPEATALQFVVYGWQEDSGVLIYLDFAELHQRGCQGHDAPDSAASDYELWSPSDGRLGGKCLLGHRVSYTRRKRSSACFNPLEHERAKQMEHCPCTPEDYQCDQGYLRKGVDSTECVRDPEADPPQEPPETCENFYFVTKGYRRVPGDTCEGGAMWDRVQTPCPGWIGGSWFGKLVMLILVLVLVALAVSSMSTKSEFVEDCLDSIRRKFKREDYWEIGKKMPHSMADDDFGLQDEEYGQSAHLIGRRSGSGDDEADEEDALAPLPERRAARQQAVPKLSGPPAGDALDAMADDFE